MECHPHCVFPLPQAGTARIRTEFTMCMPSPEFRVNIRHDVPSTSVFKAQTPGIKELRNIGTEHWPLKLDVDFHRVPSQTPDLFRIKACILTERSNQLDCFMNQTFRASEIDDCTGVRGSSTPLFLLSLLLVLFLMTVAIGLVVVVHRLYARYSQFRNKRQTKFTKPQNCSQLLPSHQSHSKFDIEDDRLTVIEEEGESEAEQEDVEYIHQNTDDRRDSASSGFGSEHDGIQNENASSRPPFSQQHSRPIHTVISMNGSNRLHTTFHTFKPLAQEV